MSDYKYKVVYAKAYPPYQLNEGWVVERTFKNIFGGTGGKRYDKYFDNKEDAIKYMKEIKKQEKGKI